MIRLSIITPYYNMPETLCRLSASIPQEPWIEHIIVNDKSDMDPAALLNAKQYVTARGARWYDNTTQYKGTGICRDIGIRRAAGEWILIADADDFFKMACIPTKTHINSCTGLIRNMFFNRFRIKAEGIIHIGKDSLQIGFLNSMISRNERQRR